MSNHALLNGDCLEILKTLPNNSVDSLVTDPPAGISFMCKAWDDDKGGRKQWVAWMAEVMSECLRVLKPGAHGLVWALPRTSHWTATALEEAGFEVRDVVTHLFGSGFPKSLNVEKAGAGNDWAGWGTALKPASEHWILVRKQCSEKTVAKNVLKWGTGALNIDASRVGTEQVERGRAGRHADQFSKNAYANGSGYAGHHAPTGHSTGRFPANLILDEEAGALLDEQSGTLKSGGGDKGNKTIGAQGYGSNSKTYSTDEYAKNSGGASRFFYCAKTSSSERNAGLEGIELRPKKECYGKGLNTATKLDPKLHTAEGVAARTGSANTHPTVKPQKLMRYLIRMVTPPGGVVLDCFAGSGSTGVAALSEGFGFLGIEKEPEYFEIATKRLEHEEGGSNEGAA